MPGPASTPSLATRLLAPITRVEPDEVPSALLLTLNVFLLLTAYYLLKPVREALILAQESGAEYKAYMSGVIALVLLVAVPAYAKLVDRMPRGRLVVGVTLFFVSHLVLFFLAGQSEALRSRLGLVFYVWVGIFNMMVVAQFWAFANDVYDEEQGKRLFPLVALGASVGAALGSKLAASLIPLLGVYAMLPAGGAVLSICALLFWAVDRREPERRSILPPEGLDESVAEAVEKAQAARSPARSGAFALVFSQRYLWLIALFAVVFSWANTNGEYLLGKLVKGAADLAVREGRLDEAGKGAFIGATYGDFFFYVNVLGVLFQSFVVSRLVRWFGLVPLLFVMPLIVLGNAALIALIPVLAIVRAGKILENSTDYSLNNTLRQMLWLVTSRQVKYKAKQAVDTFFVRSGDMASALLVGVGTTWLGWELRQFALANAVLGVVWVAITVFLAREHRRISSAKS